MKMAEHIYMKMGKDKLIHRRNWWYKHTRYLSHNRFNSTSREPKCNSEKQRKIFDSQKCISKLWGENSK